MSKDVVGSNRALSINGVNFRVSATSNFSRIMTKYENTRIPTSGASMRKMMKRVLTTEGIELNVNGAEIAVLKSFAESLDDALLSYTTAANDTYKATGSVEVENIDTEEGKATVKIDPVDDWTPFLG
jgi:hypothetical protein